VGPAARVAVETPVGLLAVAASDGGTLVGDWTAGLACVAVVGGWVALVPQAKTPITTAINGRASSRDIYRLPPTVQVDRPSQGLLSATTVFENKNAAKRVTGIDTKLRPSVDSQGHWDLFRLMGFSRPGPG